MRSTYKIMFRTLSGTADPRDYSDPVEEKPKRGAAGNSHSGESTESDVNVIERTAGQSHEEEYEDEIHEEKAPIRQSRRSSKELTRTTSHALSRVSSHLTTRSLPDPGPPPDGGLKAWSQIACGWIAIATCWGWINCFGVFQTYYTLTLDVAPSSISWIGTVQNFLSFTIGAFSGRLLDAGYFLPTAFVGVVLQVLGIFMMSLSTKYWQLMLTQGVLCGIGGGLYFTPCMGVMATWFSKRRSFAMGVASTGNSVGGMIYPVIVRELLPKIGFAWTTRVLGFMNLGLLSLVLIFMKPRLPPRKSHALIDWSAFRELPFTLFCIGMYLQVWDIYYTLYYVSMFSQ